MYKMLQLLLKNPHVLTMCLFLVISYTVFTKSCLFIKMTTALKMSLSCFSAFVNQLGVIVFQPGTCSDSVPSTPPPALRSVQLLTEQSDLTGR